MADVAEVLATAAVIGMTRSGTPRCLGQPLGVAARARRGAQAGHRHGQRRGTRQAGRLQRVEHDEQGERRIEPARKPITAVCTLPVWRRPLAPGRWPEWRRSRGSGRRGRRRVGGTKGCATAGRSNSADARQLRQVHRSIACETPCPAPRRERRRCAGAHAASRCRSRSALTAACRSAKRSDSASSVPFSAIREWPE
jgi:hypothetical protein